MNFIGYRHAIAGLLAAVLLISCGGGGSGPSTESPASAAFVAQTATKTVGAAGGTVSLTLTDGTVIELVVPSGALMANTDLSLTSQAPVSGQRFNVLMKPAGLILTNGAVAVVNISLPSGQTLPTTAGLIYDSVPIAFTKLSDGRIQVSLSTFAGNPTATATGVTMLAAVTPRMAAALNTTSSDPCAGATASGPLLSTKGGLSVADIVAISLYGECMVDTINNLLINEQFVEALRVANSVTAYIQLTGTIHSSSDQFIALATTAACTGYRTALDRASATTVSTMGTLYELIKPIMFWEMAVQKLGATCPGIGLTDYQTVIAAKTDEAHAYYTVVKPNITATSSANYTTARTEAIKSVQTQREVLALNPNAALRTTLNAQVTQRAEPGVIDAMLQAPWNLCRNSTDYSELINLMLTLDSPDAVKNAAQYCGTVLNAQTKDSTGSTVIATLATPLGGVAAGQNRVSDSIKATKTAKLTLNGPIQALQCPLGVTAGNESLTIKLDGTTIQSQNTAPFLATPLEIDLATALESAHPGATAALMSAALTIERTGTSCADFWGVNPAPLLSLTLNFGSAKILFDAFSSPLGDLYAVSPDGSGLTKLGHGVTPSFIQWLSNYTKVAFRASDNAGGFTYWSVNPDGSSPTQLQLPLGLNDTNPVWSPDGRKVAYLQNSSSAHNPICVWNIDGSGQNCFEPFGLGYWQGIYGPSWSPDGTKIAVVFQPSAQYSSANIYIMNVDGTGVVNFTNYPVRPGGACTACAAAAAWSPDGSRIAFSATDGSNTNNYGVASSDIFVMNVDGSGFVQLTTDGLSEGPVWSPDGSQIAYTYGLGYGNSRNYVRIMNANGTGQVPVAQGWHPSWR